MTLSIDALLVVSVMMAVFAAVSTIGSSLYLGAGYERLRAGFETIKRQTAFFSDAIHKLDTRVDNVEKQGQYFFEAISDLEKSAAKPEQWADQEPSVSKEIAHKELIQAYKGDALQVDLLTADGFTALHHRTPAHDNEPISTRSIQTTHFH